ncbi:transglutaminase family protein [Ahrensia sp. R2A130]|uniref:transglutaminase family protein n=1 Tax=Ahrensia sp. R2A130 TaxID=744979 RepID=UPI0001E094A5|nr:transglutaminase family protein [Ahrensia sp. R2A130]EFL88361.1 transglutaminase family protein [Ahrensia sp. R2A130]
MILTIRHTTAYRYDAPVGAALQQVKLTPQDGPHQKVLDWAITIEGGRSELIFDDQHANRTHLVQAAEGTGELKIIAEGRVETTDSSGVYGEHYGTAPLWHFLSATELTTPGPEIRKLARENKPGDDLVAGLHALSQAIRDATPYQTGATYSATDAESALKGAQGVCQDHAQIFCTAARLLDIPARYVSGYLRMNEREEQDATHAWAEAHVEGLGWVGFDVSNGYSPDERYVRIGCGRDYRECAPVRGLRRGGATETLEVAVFVSPHTQTVESSQQQQ